MNNFITFKNLTSRQIAYLIMINLISIQKIIKSTINLTQDNTQMLQTKSTYQHFTFWRELGVARAFKGVYRAFIRAISGDAKGFV